jgi:c(7)-type cytochrome triheme protein
MNKLALVVVAVVCVSVLEGLSVLVGAQAPPEAAAPRTAFPHARHAGLFPNCTACHAGIAGDDAAAFYTVQQSDCARCHDGRVQPVVAWSPPPARAGNLVFSHRRHAASNIACSACHATPGTPERMAVTMPGPERCLECHGKTSHFAAATRCDGCHAALAAAPAVPEARIAGYPQPDDHRDRDFVRAHAADARAGVARCSVCHTRDSCERCHLNGAGVTAIASLAPDARVASLVRGKPGAWPAPADHSDRAWSVAHGQAAQADIQSCANCHVQSSCNGCHVEVAPAGLAALPVAAAGDMRGVLLAGARPPHHPPGFDRRHAAAATTQAQRCDACHSQSSCAACHEAAFEPQFHPRDYRHRHAAEAYARDTDCASCHSTEAFCRDCHATTGIASRDSRTAAYHDAHPLWLLDHGRAARQGLDNCASCHQQSDCLQCHSARSGWRINPHGPDFDAGRMGDRSLESCSVCHFGDPRPR